MLLTANLIAALAFAGAHLPAWSAIGALSLGTSAMVLVLNATGGLVFGHAFIKRGILAAICAHAGADCAIQILGPMTHAPTIAVAMTGIVLELVGFSR